MHTHHEVLSLKEICFNQKDNRLTEVRLIFKKIKSEETESEESIVTEIHLISSAASCSFKV